MLILSTKLKNRFSSTYTVKLKNIIINGNKRGCSGFISYGNSIVYVNTEVLGGGYLYRTAESFSDYTGGVNKIARDMDGLVRGVNELLAAQVIQARSGIPADRLIISFAGA